MKLFRISTVPTSLNILLKGQLKFLSDYYDVTAISGAGKELDEVAEREGVKVYPIEIERKISPLKDFVSLVKLYRYFKKEKPDIIHSITPKAGLLSMIAGKLARVPVRMHTFTGLIFPHKDGLSQDLLIFTDKVLCSSATHLFPEGDGVKKDLIKHKITKKPLKIIGNGNVNGIDLDYFNPDQISESQMRELRKEVGISEDDFVFIFVGRLVKDKGINELVSAFKNICESYEAIAFSQKNAEEITATETDQLSNSKSQEIKVTPKLQHSNSSTPKNSNSQKLQLPKTPAPKLLLVGPFEQHLDPLLLETLEEIKENPNIILTGFQEDVRPYFAISNSLVFPSYREGFPNVVLQAGAMNLPSIVTNISGCNEIITNGENGLVITPKNAQQLKEKMMEIVENPNLCKKLKENCRVNIQNRYSQKYVWEALLYEYRAAVKLIKKS